MEPSAQEATMNEARYRAAESELWRSVDTTVTERRVRLTSTGTEVRIQITGEGAPVVLLHGGPNAGSAWAPLVGRLKGFRCYIVDRPGTGLSDDYVMRQPRMLDIADHFVAQVLDGLEIDRAHLVASSFGGFLAIRSAAVTPDRIDRMVQMACPAFAPGMKIPKFMKSLRNGFLRWLIPRLPPHGPSSEDIMRQLGHGASLDAGRMSQDVDRWYAQLHRHTNTLKNDFAMIASALEGDPFDMSLALTPQILGAVRTPTLFLWGTEDGFGGEDVARATVAAMPNAELEMCAGFGHLPWLDDASLIAQRTGEFLSRPAR
jgi:pimeloyl-ACP methyl ester carboxylesterase